MSGSVREEIILSIVAAVGGIPDVGTRPGGSDKAVYDAAEDFAGEIAEVVRGGKRAIEIAFDDDVPDFDNAVNGADAFRFDVGVLIHLPDSLPEGSSYTIEAARAYADVHKVYAHAADPTIGTWSGRATGTENLGGGGVSISSYGTRCVAASFRVRYRHKTGDPLEAV